MCLHIRNGQYCVESKRMSLVFIHLTKQTHHTRMNSIIKTELIIKNPKGISPEPHILPLIFVTYTHISHIFERNCVKKSPGTAVSSRTMPSKQVKIKVEIACQLREDDGITS